MKTIIKIWGIFLVIGIVLVGTGLLVISLQNKNKKDRVYTTGTITRIVKETDMDNDTTTKVYVQYLAGGEELESELRYYTTGMREGSSIEIYYLKSKPESISCDAGDALIWILPGIGSLFLVMGAIGVGINLVKASKEGKIKEMGKPIFAPIKEVKEITTVSVRGKHPYKIICEYKDPETKKTHTYESNPLWSDPNYVIANNNITSLKIYVDPENPKHYAVETDFFEKR